MWLLSSVIIKSSNWKPPWRPIWRRIWLRTATFTAQRFRTEQISIKLGWAFGWCWKDDRMISNFTWKRNRKKSLDITSCYLRSDDFKRTFGILEIFQKTNKRIRFFTMTNSFIRFLGEFEDTKKSFWNYLTFSWQNSKGF